MLTNSANDTWCTALCRIVGARQSKPVSFNVTNADVGVGIANVELNDPERLLGVHVSCPEEQVSKSL